MTVLVLERVIEYARRSFTVLVVVLVVVLVARQSFTVLVVLVVVLVARRSFTVLVVLLVVLVARRSFTTHPQIHRQMKKPSADRTSLCRDFSNQTMYASSLSCSFLYFFLQQFKMPDNTEFNMHSKSGDLNSL